MFLTRLAPSFLIFCSVFSVSLFSQVTRNGLLREWLPSSGISRTGDAPYELQNGDTWASATGGNLTVKDADADDSIQIEATTIGGLLSVAHTATSNTVDFEGGALRVSSANDPGQPVTWDFWIMLGDLSTDAIFFETGGGTYGASVTIGDGDVLGDDDPEDTGRRDDLRFVLGGTGANTHLALDMDLPDTVTSQFHHVACVYDGQDMILYLDGLEAARHATGASNTRWQGTDAFGLLGQGGSSLGANGGSGTLPFFNNWVGAKATAGFRWYNRGLSKDEVYKNYLAEKNVVLKDRVLHYWKLDEAGGATESADENTTTPANLAISGASPGHTGILGSAVSFSGADEKLTHALAENLPLSRFTVSLWAKADNAGLPNNTGLFNSGSSNNDFQLEVLDGNYNYHGDSGDLGLGTVTTEWVHLAAVLRGKELKVYQDGVLKGTGTSTDNVFQRFQVGINRNENMPFNGLIDDVLLASEALFPEEVAALHGLGRFSGITFDSPLITSALALQNGEKLTDVGTELHIWSHASGLAGEPGSTSGTIDGRDAVIVLRPDGTGLRYDGQPGDGPAIVKYSVNPAVYSKDAPITANVPTTQGEPTSFALTGTLPDGLSMDAATGAITGTPTTIAAETTVQITASNVHGDSAAYPLAITIGDLTGPVISVTGAPRIHIEVGDNYTDDGATATDNVDATVQVETAGSVDTSTAGFYTITYTATDAAGNDATPATRLVVVEDLSPIVSTIGSLAASVNQPDPYENDPGAEVDAFPHVPLAYYSMAGHARDTGTWGNAYDGTLAGDAQFVTETHDQKGQSLYLDGNGDYLSVPGWKVIQGNQARTISLWIKTDYAPDATAFDNTIASWGTDALEQKWIFRVQDDDGTAGAIRVEINGGNLVGSTLVNDNAWHHVAAVFPEGANVLSDLKLYVDGAEETYSNSISRTINTGNAQDLYIGNGHANRYFLGHIDDVAIFDVALTAQQIADYYAATALAITDNIASIDTNDPGIHTITYSATDANNRTGTSTRLLEVIDVTPPSISFINNSQTVTLNIDDTWSPQTGVLATDNSQVEPIIAASILDVPLANLRLHLTADSLAAQLSQHTRISQWDDLSPHQHHLAQPSHINQPELHSGIAFSGGTLIAHSANEFSGTQGKDGWYYGYHEGNYPYYPDKFTQMAGGSGNGAWDATTQHWTGDTDDVNGSWDLVISAPSWVVVAKTMMHPQAVLEGSYEVPQQAVRRWVSDVDGEVGITGYFNNTSANGDGTFGRIFHNGVEKYTVLTDGSRSDFNILLTVATGDKVDFVVDEGPNADSGADGTNMEATILHTPSVTQADFPVVRFDGNDYFDRMDSLGLTGSPQLTVASVLKPNNTGQLLSTGSDAGTPGKIIKFHSDASFRYNNGNKEYFDNALNDGQWHAATWMTDTANGYGDGEFYDNGQAAVSTGEALGGPLAIPATETRTLVPAALSGSGALGEYLNGDIAELILLDTKATPQQLNALHHYLGSKYGFDLGANGQNSTTTYDTSYTHTREVTYYVQDAAGNTASATRTITVVGNNYPVLTLNGNNPIRTALGQAYNDPGATATDPEDGNITANIQADVSNVDTSTLGTYTVFYSITDTGGRSANATRTVQVVDMTPPAVQLVGESTIIVGQGAEYTESGITATDNVDDSSSLLTSMNHLPADGLVLHLDAAQIPGAQDGVGVATWPDLSGQGNDAYQTDLPGSQPLYVASTASNNRPAVHFDGAAQFMTIDSVLAGGTSGRTIFAVIRPDSIQNSGAIVWLNNQAVSNGTGKGHNYLMTAEVGLRVSDNKMFQNDSLSLTEPSIVGVGNQPDATIVDAFAWKNGLELVSTSSAGTGLLNVPGESSSIGARLANANPQNGDYYEILVYNRFLDEDEIRLLQYHLQEKYDTTGAAALVDTSKLGNQTVHYIVRDAAGNYGTATRSVSVVVDTWTPVINLTDGPDLEVVLNSTFTDPGFTVSDDKDDGLAASVQSVIKDSQGQTVQTVDTSVDATTFTITYTVTDSDGHTGSATRNLTIIDADTVAPVIYLNGPATTNHPVGQAFTDPGATAMDNVDGAITPTPASDVDPDTIGSYTITYSAADAAGNVAIPVDRTVLVQDLSPVIVLQGDSPQTLAQNATWTEPGTRSVVLPAIPLVYLSFDNHLRDHATADGAQDGAGDITWSADTPMGSGTSIQVDGSNQVTLTGYKGILAGGDRSVSIWVKANPAINNSAQEIVYWGKDTNLQRFTLRINNEANLNEFRTDANGVMIHGTTNIITNTWRHLVVNYPQDGTFANARMYVDGNLESGALTSGAVDTPLNTVADQDLRIGSGFTGFIDEFLLFDQELSAAQIAALHQPETPAVTASTDTVDTSSLGSTDIIYTAIHTYGTSTATRTVNVVDMTPPVITLAGNHPLPWQVGEAYVEPGASATDDTDGTVPVIHSLTFPDSGLVAHWKLDEEVGTDAIDSSPNLQNGTILAGTTIGQEGAKDFAFSFDGQTGGINMGDVAAMDSPTAFTFSTWFNRRSEVASETNHAVSAVLVAQSNNSTNDNFEIGTKGTVVQIYIDSATGLDGKVEIEAGIQDNTWYHLVFTYDANDPDGTPARLYINNQLIEARADWQGAFDSSSTSPLSLGIARPASNKWGMLDGLMDETLIWDFALTPTQIYWLHHHQTVDVSTAGVTHPLEYTATDSAGNTTTVTRNVIITNDLVPPSLALIGDASITLNFGDTFNDPGVTATDAVDGDLAANVVITGTVDTNVADTYTLTYDVMDNSGNRATSVTRTVIVQPASDNFTAWLTETGLNALSTADKALDADPDNDQLPNLVEYAFGSDPTSADAPEAPSVSVSGGQATLTFLRPKVAVDSTITIVVQTTEDLVAGPWTNASVTISPSSDNSPVPDPDLERVEATLPTPSGKEQFIRLMISR